MNTCRLWIMACWTPRFGCNRSLRSHADMSSTTQKINLLPVLAEAKAGKANKARKCKFFKHLWAATLLSDLSLCQWTELSLGSHDFRPVDFRPADSRPVKTSMYVASPRISCTIGAAFSGVAIFPVHRELFMIFTDNLWFESGERESHADHDLHG